MANGLITRVRGVGDAPAGRVTRVRGQGPLSTPAHGLVTMVRGATGSLGQTKVTRVRGRFSGPYTPISAGPDQTLEPLINAVLSSAGPPVEDISSWDWTQIAGPTVTLTGSGPDRQYVTPATRTGTVLTFRVTIAFNDLTVSTDTVTHTIRAHGGPWIYIGTVLTGVAVG